MDFDGCWEHFEWLLAPFDRILSSFSSPISDWFQKAIQECETEWSDNQKLVKLKDRRIAKSIPKGLPYFHVDFGMDAGFATPCEVPWE